MFVPDTPRTAQYRFWFDVREPGAAAYAAKLGSVAVIYFGISAVRQFAVRSHWVVGLIWFMAMLRLSGGMRQLSPVYYVVTRVYFFVPRIDLMTLVVLSGLPLAVWAAWVHWGLTLEERRQLVEMGEPVAGWKGLFGEWVGWLARKGSE